MNTNTRIKRIRDKLQNAQRNSYFIKKIMNSHMVSHGEDMIQSKSILNAERLWK